MTEQNLFGLSIQTIKKINSVFAEEAKVEKVIIYGSRAKGSQKIGSDIDLTMIGPQLDIGDLLRLENKIDDLLLPNKIDLSILAKIENQELLDHIKRVGQVFYERKR